MTSNMPEAYGGGAAKALPLYQTAEEKFKAFQPKSEISPNWGKEINENELKNVQNTLNK
jgi:hypothetical protein